MVLALTPAGLFLRFEAAGGLLTGVCFVDGPQPAQGTDPALGAAAEWLAAYARGRKAVCPPLDWSRVSVFRREVYRVLLETRPGETLSYGGLALRAGHPGAARATGSGLRANPWPVIVPCHRVLPGGGALGAYSPGPEYKKKLLVFEGHNF
jgi:methylated-DNA-[protein]-cysteine S-methyltransferase